MPKGGHEPRICPRCGKPQHHLDSKSGMYLHEPGRWVLMIGGTLGRDNGYYCAPEEAIGKAVGRGYGWVELYLRTPIIIGGGQVLRDGTDRFVSPSKEMDDADSGRE